MKKIQLSNILKGFLGDAVWSIAGLVLMNVVAQFVVYPIWNRTLGSEEYGNIIFAISIMNIVVVSIGGSCNYARMRNSVGGRTNNRPYLYALTGGCIAALPLLFLMRLLGALTMSFTEFVFFFLLLCATIWRTYADVEYRLTLNYRGYFFYYLIISGGYLLGIGLFMWSGLWPLALLPGELAGILRVLICGTIFKKDIAVTKALMQDVFRLIFVLLGSNFIANLVFNGDRLLLQFLVGGSAVAIYYVASLFGKTMSLLTVPLNGVLIGYFAKYQGKFTISQMHKITLITLGITATASAACVVGSNLFIPVLYPAEYGVSKAYFFLANLAQIFYFVGTIIANTVLLRFAKANFQIYLNIAYAVLFCILCIPLAVARGMKGFCIGLLLTCAIRFALCLLLCYRDTERE